MGAEFGASVTVCVSGGISLLEIGWVWAYKDLERLTKWLYIQTAYFPSGGVVRPQIGPRRCFGTACGDLDLPPCQTKNRSFSV